MHDSADAVRVPEVARPTRRDLLHKGSVAAAATGMAWVVPQVQTFAGAQSAGCSNFCTPTDVNLLALPFGNGVDVVATSPKAALGTNITFTRTNTDSISAPLTTGVVSNLQVGNISTGFIPLVVKANNTTQTVAMTLTFSVPIRQLEFTLVDIDANDTTANPYQEQVVISWTSGIGTPVPAYAPGSNLTGPPPADTYQVLNGSYNANATDPTCNLGVDFGACGTISSVTITSNDLDTRVGTSTTAGRAIGIASLRYCPA
jgi:hypothetical protein